MIRVQDFATTDSEKGQVLCAAIKYDDGTFDVIAAVHDTKTGAKFVRVFQREPFDAHIVRANAWLEAGGIMPPAELQSTRKA
jgi:hypothetical protein